MEIKEVTLSDLPSVKEIEDLTFKHGYPLFVFRQWFDITPDLFFVAKENDTVTGYIIGHINAKNEAWILSLGVHPNHQGKKVGFELSNYLLKILESKNCKNVLLTVSPNNSGAIYLYEKIGFSKIKKEKNYFLDTENRWLMKFAF